MNTLSDDLKKMDSNQKKSELYERAVSRLAEMLEPEFLTHLREKGLLPKNNEENLKPTSKIG